MLNASGSSLNTSAMTGRDGGSVGWTGDADTVFSTSPCTTKSSSSRTTFSDCSDGSTRELELYTAVTYILRDGVHSLTGTSCEDWIGVRISSALMSTFQTYRSWPRDVQICAERSCVER